MPTFMNKFRESYFANHLQTL